MTDLFTYIKPEVNNAFQIKKSASIVSKTSLVPPLPQELSLAEIKPIIDSRPVQEIIKTRVQKAREDKNFDCEDAFFVADLNELTRQYSQWKTLCPRIEPFYAVKCNPDPVIIKKLFELGTNFDCASRAEIQMVIEAGADSSQIIYANPCKQASHIQYAHAQGVSMMTFDNIDELYKIKKFHPNAQLILRILTDDSKSICKLGTKFGASKTMVPVLLKLAQELDLNLVGVSFHVGSGCYDAQAFGDAVVQAKAVFDLAKDFGFTLSLLDVGGGFPGRISDGVQFPDIAHVLNHALNLHFPENVRIIAEPGRYFVASAYTLVVNVVARRVALNANSEPTFMYYINDGIYGSFNCITFDHATVVPRALFVGSDFLYKNDHKLELKECSIWGPTCDSIDCIGKNCLLPILSVGDFLYFENMGAYTMCAASQFNGFKKSSVFYTIGM